MSSDIEKGVSPPFSLNRIETKDESSTNHVSSSQSVEVDSNRKTWDFSKTSSLYSRIVLALNSFSDIVSSVYSFSFALAVLVSFSNSNGGYLTYYDPYDDYTYQVPTNQVSQPTMAPILSPTAIPTPAPSGRYIHPNPYIVDYFSTQNAKFFLIIWVLTEGISMAILISFRLYANLRFSKVTGDPTLALRRLLVVKVASMLHYCLVLWSTAGFSATIASFNYIQEQKFSTINQYLLYGCNVKLNGISCTAAIPLSSDLLIIVVAFAGTFLAAMIEYYCQPLVNCPDGLVIGILLQPYIFLVLIPYYAVSVFVMPIVYTLVQILVESLCPDEQLMTILQAYGVTISYMSEVFCAAAGKRDLSESYASMSGETRRQFFSVGITVAASFCALMFGLTCVFLSFQLFAIINPTTLQNACAPFTPSSLVSLWIFCKIVQIAVSMIIPIVRMWFAGKLRKFCNLVYILFVVDTIQLITDHMFVLMGQQLQQAREEVAKLRATLITEIDELSNILFDMPLGEQK